MRRWTREPPKPSPSKGLRALVVFVAVFSLFAQLSNVAHHLVVRHAICPEHGELVHVGDADHASVHSSGQPDDGETPAVRSLAASEDEHAHDHCVLLSERREQWIGEGQSLALEPPPAVELSAPAWVERSGHPLPVALFLLAPKGSPPV